MLRHQQTESQPVLPRIPAQYPAHESLTPDLADAIVARREDYLDRVFAPLTHLLPFPRRSDMRTEMRQHLDAMIGAYVELGESEERACEKAFAQFGKPEEVAESIKKNTVYPTVGQRLRAWFAQPRMSVAGAVPVLLFATALYFGLARPVTTTTQTTATTTQVASAAGQRVFINGVAFNHKHAVMVAKIPCASCHRVGDQMVDERVRVLEAQAAISQVAAQQARDDALRARKP